MVTTSINVGFIWKAVIITFCLNGFAGTQHCNAQYIVGKWKQVSGKMFCTPEAVKNSHGHLQDVMEMPKADVVDEFKADNTLTETITSGTTKTSTSGTWTMSGKNVTISILGHKPMSGIVSDADNILIYTVEMPKSEHMQVSKREWTFSKI
jgi:hypothetical protein